MIFNRTLPFRIDQNDQMSFDFPLTIRRLIRDVFEYRKTNRPD